MTEHARLLWVTNLAAPYRLPVWESLGERCQLRVGLLESSARLARDTAANRGADWGRGVASAYEQVEYSTVRVARGEDRHYTLTSAGALRDVARADAVLLGGWDSPAYWQLLGQAKLMRKRTIGFYESTLASQGRRTGLIAAARARYFRAMDRVVVPGVAAQQAVRSMGVAPERILTGFNAVDVEAFAAASGRREDSPGHRFLYVGQLIARKNVEGIVRAFAAMAGPQDTLTFIGRGELHERLVEVADKSGVSDQVTFVDYLPYADLPAEMAKHDTLVLASHVEVWGLVVNEALACGLQVVVTRNCGVAPSVSEMPGVFVGPLEELEGLMKTAQEKYSGHIEFPPILEHTPEAFASVFADALEQVTKPLA
ncbi:glycosyltransferase family 4 protein [Luteococcus sp. OSA5]|uniref:glycosyltransferase family 4 protein n=1 Tax=Luteococcus sp. OSA5 TaxID=3401630 RepID=UPI003B435507